MRQRCNNNTKRPKLGIARNLKNLRILPENSAEDLGTRRALLVSLIYVNAPTKLLHLPPKTCYNFTQWFKERHNWSITVTQLRSVSRHANTSSPGIYRRKQTNQQAHLELCHRHPWQPGKGAKLDRVIQLNCGEVRTHASYKTTRTWENFNNRGTKMILLSDKL